jgi:hypothetical protein
MTKAIILIFWISILFCAADTSNASCPANFISTLESQYRTYEKVALSGNMSEYAKIRTTPVFSFMKARLEKAGKANQMGELVKNMVKSRPQLSEFKFVDCESSKTEARILYQKNSGPKTASAGEEVIYLLIMFGNEANTWKVGETKQAYIDRSKIKTENYPNTMWEKDSKFQIPSH